MKNGILTATGGSGWFNLISDDWTEIYESPPDSTEIANHIVEPFDRYVFMCMRKHEYRFVGIFTTIESPEFIDGVRYEVRTTLINDRRFKVFERIGEEIDLTQYLFTRQ